MNAAAQTFDFYLIGSRTGYYLGFAKHVAKSFPGQVGWKRRIAQHRKGSCGSALARRLLRSGARARRVGTIVSTAAYAAHTEVLLWEYFFKKGWKPVHHRPYGGAPEGAVLGAAIRFALSSPTVRKKMSVAGKKNATRAWAGAGNVARRKRVSKRMLAGGASKAGLARMRKLASDPVAFAEYQSVVGAKGVRVAMGNRTPAQQKEWHQRGCMSSHHSQGKHKGKPNPSCPRCQPT